MTKRELQIYVKQQLASGVNPEVLKFVLASDGWKDEDIAEVLNNASGPGATEEPVKPRPVKRQPEVRRPVKLEAAPKEAAPAPAPLAAPTVAPVQPVRAMPASSPADLPFQNAIPPVSGKRSLRKWLIGGSIGLVVLLAAAYGAYAYYIQTPSYVLNKTLLNMSSVKTVEYSGTVTGEVSGNGPLGLGKTSLPLALTDGGKVAGLTTYKADLKFNGRLDVTKLDDPRSEMTLQLDYQNTTIKVDTRTVDGDFYLKAEQVPNYGGYDFQKLIGVWVKAGGSTLESLGGTSGRPTIDAEKEQQFKDALKQYQVLKLTNRAKEDVAGVPTYRYDYEIDKENLKKYLAKAIEIGAGDKLGSLPDTSKFLDELTFKTGRIWIGRKDHMVHKIVSGISFRSDETALTLDLELTLGNYNQPIQITAPSTFKSFEQVWQDLQAENESQAMSKSADARRLADIRQLQTGLELYFNDFGKYPGALSDLSKNSTYQYLYAIPTPPSPPAGGCTEAQNAYAYKQLKKGADYSLTFCLGNTYPTYAAGMHTASSSGIK